MPYYSDQDKAEVDFIVQSGLEIFPIEVKARKLKQPAFTRSFRSFIKTYKPGKAFLVNLNLEEKKTIDSTKIKTLPFYKDVF